MEPTQNLDFEEFQKAITPQFLFLSRILYTAMLAGVSFFLVILLILIQTPQAPKNFSGVSNDFVIKLSMVHIVFMPACYILSYFVFRSRTNPANLHKIKSSPGFLQTEQKLTDEERYLGAILGAYLFRAASFEAPAIFGIMICLLADFQGYIQQHPKYWLNLISFAVMVIAMIYTFPTRAKLEDLFKKRCISKPAHIC